MSSYKLYHNGKVFVFEGEGQRVTDANVHALMPKIKRLKIGVEQCTESKKSISKTNTTKRRQS
jgi:hypothetical protein